MVVVLVKKNNFIIKNLKMKKVSWDKVKEVAGNILEWFAILFIIAVLVTGAAIEFGFIQIGG